MSTPTATFTTPADELARVLVNVSLVAKKSPQYPTIRLHASTTGLMVTGTDGYCAAIDTCTGTYDGQWTDFRVEITRDALDALEKAARPCKKDDVKLCFYPGDSVILETYSGKEVAHEQPPNPAVWRSVDELFALKEAGPFELPDLAAIDMRLLARFWRVKSSTGTHVADLMFTGAEAPILIKMGSTFKALAMPIKRERHVEAFPEGLW